MIVCKMCGNHNDEAAAFCGDCGKFLEWDGERVAPPPEVVVVVEEPPPVVEEKLNWWQRLVAKIKSKMPSSYVEPRKPVAAAVATWTSDVELPPEPPPDAGDNAEPKKKPPPPPPGGAAKKPPPPPPGAAKKPPPPPPGAAAKAAPPPPPGAAARTAPPPPPGAAAKAAPPPPPGAAARAAPPPPPGAAAKAAPPPPGAAAKAAPPPPPGAAARAAPPPPPGAAARAAPPPPPGAAARAAPPPPPGAKAAPPPPPGAAARAAPPPPPGAAAKVAPPPPPGAAAKAAPPPPPGAVKTAPPPPPGAVKTAPPPPPGAKAAPPPGARAAPPPPPAPARPDPDLIAALAQPVTGVAESKISDEPPELKPAPAVVKTRAIVKTKPSRRLELGDLVCAVCGEGNSPSRNFCSRCGESLAEAGVVKPVWWRRLLAWRGRAKKYKAGTRPGEKGTREHRNWLAYLSFRRLRVVAVIVGLIVGLIYSLYPPFRETVRDNMIAAYRKVSPNLEPVRPVVVTSTTASVGHQPDKISDTYNDTYWMTEWGGSRPRVTFRFGNSYLLRSVIIHSGASNAFMVNGRPSILRLTYNTGKTESILPSDSSRAQTITLKNTTLVTTVTVEVADVFEGSENKTVAISEIEFFALK